MLSEHPFADAQVLASALAAAVAAELRDALVGRGRASLAVSGGRTPAAFLDALSEQPLAWSEVEVVPTDDRWVGPDHLDSNDAMIRRHLLRNAAAAARVQGLVDVALTPIPQGENRGEALLKALPHPFDVVVLGMGADGHTASLFPMAPQLAPALDLDSGRSCMIVDPVAAPHRRISLTLPALLQSRRIVLLFTGESKLRVYRRALESGPAAEIPVSLILHQQQVPVDVYWSL